MSSTTENEIAGPSKGSKCNCVLFDGKDKTPRRAQIYRRIPGPQEVGIEVICCGICHTDLHFISNDFSNTIYPLVPGHEIVGIVRVLGSEVGEFYRGQRVAVGTYVDACRQCKACARGEPQYCTKQLIATYNTKYEADDNWQTFGGYSTFITVDQRFVYAVPSNLPSAGVAPLLCAGATVFSPMKYTRIGQHSVVGVAGIGGLGHLAVRIARALGARVIALSRTEDKRQESRRLGASDFLIMTDDHEFERRIGTMDLIIDTISAGHDIKPYFRLLGTDGKIALLGASVTDFSIGVVDLLFQRKAIFGSAVASPNETRELLDLCGAYNIIADVEVVSADDLGEALDRLRRNDVRYRFVIDNRTLKKGFNGKLLQSTSYKILRELAEKKAKAQQKNSTGTTNAVNSESEEEKSD